MLPKQPSEGQDRPAVYSDHANFTPLHEATDLYLEVTELRERVAKLRGALEKIVEDNLHTLEPGGGCVYGCEYNSSNIPCIVETAKQALNDTKEGV